MPDSNTERIDEIVDPKVLQQLSALDVALDKTFDQMVKMLGKTIEVEKSLGSIAVKYKDLVDAISKYESIQRRSNSTQTEQERILRQQEQLRQRISNAYSEESLELVRLQQVMQQITRTRRNLVQEQNAQTGSTVQLRAQLNLLIQSYDAMGRSTRNSPIGRQVHEDIQRLTTEISALERETGRFSRNVGNYMQRAGVAFGTFVGNLYTKGLMLLTSALKGGISTIIDFQKANSFLASVLGENVKDIEDLTKSARALGATSRYTASQVTELQTELAKLGFSRQEIKDSQKDILNFATALDANLADAAVLAGASLRAFGADTKETQRYASAMTIAANRTALSFEYLATAMPIVAPVAKAFNFSIEDTLALLGQLSNSGFDASMAATALRNIFLNLADSNGKLAKSIGGPVTNIEDLVKGLQTLSDRGIDLATSLELTDKRSVAAFQTFIQGAKDLVPLRDSLIDVGGELQRIADDQLNNVDGSIKMLNSAWESLMLSFSNSTGPMKTVIDGLTDIVLYLDKVLDNMEKYTNSNAFAKVTEGASKQLAAFKKMGIEMDLSKGGDSVKIFESHFKELDKTVSDTEFALDRFKKEKEVTSIFGNKVGFLIEDSEYINELERKAEIARKTKKILEDYQKETSKIPETSTTKSGGVTVLTDAEIKKAESDRKKRADAELKAEHALSEFKAKDAAELNKRIVDDNKKGYEERLKNLDLYIENQKSSIEVSRKNQIESLKESEMTSKAYNDSVILINLKAEAEVNKITQEGAKTRLVVEKDNTDKQLKLIMQRTSTSIKEIEKSESDELLELTRSYANKEISTKEYESRRISIIKKAATDRMDVEVQNAEAAVALTNLTDEQQEDLNKKLGDARIEYEKYVNQELLANEKKTADQRLEIEKQLSDKRKELISASLELVSTLFSANTDKQIAKLDKQSEANSEYYDKEQQKVEQLAQDGVITEEEADAQKAYIAEQQEKREADLEEKRKEILQRQAKFEKALAATRVIIDTASAVMKITAQLGVLAAPLIPAIIATGAVQLATILASPIPQYAEGTDNHKGGLAIVGDGGKHEMVVTPDGKTYKTPNTNTLVDLPAHSQVLPDYNKAIEALMYKQTIIPIENDKTIIISENKKQIGLAQQNNMLLGKMIKGQKSLMDNQVYTNSLMSITKIGRA